MQNNEKHREIMKSNEKQENTRKQREWEKKTKRNKEKQGKAIKAMRINEKHKSNENQWKVMRNNEK